MRVYRRAYTDAKGLKRTARFWTVEYRDRGKVIRQTLKVTSAKVAQVMAADIVRDVELRRAGIDTHRATRQASPFVLVDRFVAELVRRERRPAYVRLVRRRLRAVLAEVQSIAEVTGERVGRILADLAADPPGKNVERLAPRTQNGYRTALGSFFDWLLTTGQWHENPVLVVEPATFREEERKRRPLTIEDLGRFVEDLRARGAGGLARASCYLLAATAGLRRAEMGALEEHRDLDLDAATVELGGSRTKNGKAALLPLPAWTVEVLRDYLCEVPPDRVLGRAHRARGANLFASIPGVERLQADLLAAGIAPETDEGVVDFHALRTTFITMLARAGVHPAVARDLARHSDLRLTMNVYTKLVLHDGRAAVAKLERPASKGKGERGAG